MHLHPVNDAFIESLLSGERRATAQAISLVENEHPDSSHAPAKHTELA
jgi:putative protein kinase ArgK-like GTPase of G3E family